MNELGLALHRISSTKQSDGHSLAAQESSTSLMADSMNIPIVKSWSTVASSRKGKNRLRIDLVEIKREIRKNSKIKYLFVDRVNRLMREWKMMLVYIIELEQMGVKIIFCDPSQQYLNGDDQLTQLLLIIEGFKSEAENKERAETSEARMKARYSQGYYLSHPLPGYKKSATPGLHIPDSERFKLLKKAGKLIIYEQYTPSQAVKWINAHGYRTISGKKLDLDHFCSSIVNRFYCGIIDIKSDGWPKDVNGLHQQMFSKREHGLLLAIITKRNPRVRQKHNPEFPLSNILRHEECKDSGGYEKFTGTMRNPGKRPNGLQRQLQAVYDCRDCRKRIARDKAHQAFSTYLDSLDFKPDQKSFKKALLKVWRAQRGSVHQRLSALNANRGRIEAELSEIAINYTRESEGATKNALRLLIEDKDNRLKEIDNDIATTQNIELESEDFVKFAFDFAESLREKWWSISYDDRTRGEQILFNGKIYMDNAAIVHPSQLSSIYRLGSNKKALENASNAFVEELAGTAPASVSLLD